MATRVLIYDGPEATLLDWMDTLPFEAQLKIIVRVERLAECGSSLSAPESTALARDVHALIIHFSNRVFLVLYFFSAGTAVLSHGMEGLPASPAEVGRALINKQRFEELEKTRAYASEG